MRSPYSILFFAYTLLFLFCHCFAESHDSGEARIYGEILEGYDPLERPVANHTEAVHVQLKLELQQIVDIDEKNQALELNVWLNFHWYDYRLKWLPENYDNVTSIRFPPDLIWRPDILLYNSVDTSFGSTYLCNIIVFYDGKIEWIPPGITKSSCLLNIKWFPFDDQLCYLKFGSWSYSKDKIVLTSQGTDISTYMRNGEWDLLDYPSEVEEVPQKHAVHQYIYFRFHLRRRTLYFGFNLITPSLLVVTMSILGFTLPVESGEKITLEITILLSICLFMNTVADVTPITSDSLPLLSLFFFCHMVAVTVSIAFSVIVLNYHYRTPKTHSMSEWTQTILLNWLPWLLMMKRPEHSLEPPPFLTRDVSIPESLRSDHSEAECHYHFQGVCNNNNNSSRKIVDATTTQACLKLEARIEKSVHSLAITDSDTDARGTQAILLSMQQIYHELKFMTEFAAREEEIENVTNDWQFAGMVVDRLCLVFFSAFIVCATMGVLMSSPHLVA